MIAKTWHDKCILDSRCQKSRKKENNHLNVSKNFFEKFCPLKDSFSRSKKLLIIKGQTNQNTVSLSYLSFISCERERRKFTVNCMKKGHEKLKSDKCKQAIAERVNDDEKKPTTTTAKTQPNKSCYDCH